MSGSFSGVQLAIYLLIVTAALLFFVTQVMAAGDNSPSLKLEDCDWFLQTDRQVLETTTQTLDRPMGGASQHGGLDDGVPTNQLTDDDAKVWEMAVASGECPARDANHDPMMINARPVFNG